MASLTAMHRARAVVENRDGLLTFHTSGGDMWELMTNCRCIHGPFAGQLQKAIAKQIDEAVDDALSRRESP